MLGLHVLDLFMICVYFLLVIGIGTVATRRIKNKEDFFLGGRKFGKLVSIFLSFGVGTSSDTAISASRETFRLGMSGIWVQLLWLFATPFYWIIAPWYRRLRIMTGGDYFQERFHSRLLTGLYVGFGLLWLMFYIAIGMTAIGKTVEIVTNSSVTSQTAVPVIALVIIIYGVLGGLFAAAWTDTLQGILILVLSIILLPAGLAKIQWFSGLHESLPDNMFKIIGSIEHSEYTWYYIIALIVMNLVGVVVQPHIFATGGGSARDEKTARVGLVFGNFLKRFTTIMWGFTGIVALALYGDRVTDPDMIWGYATRQLLGPGFVGLMIACLLAAAMSSADAFMVCGSALFTRNFFEPLFPNRPETLYVLVARIISVIMVFGAVALSLYFNNILSLIKYIWQLPVIFGAVFWSSILWRRITKGAALVTVCYSWLMIVFLPNILPPLDWTSVNSPYVHIFHVLDMMQNSSDSVLMTITYSLDVLVPFLLLILTSLLTQPEEKEKLDYLYAKFHTRVTSDPEEDKKQVMDSLENPDRFDRQKWIKHPDWEMLKPTPTVFFGFIGCFVIAIMVLGFAFLIANLQFP